MKAYKKRKSDISKCRNSSFWLSKWKRIAIPLVCQCYLHQELMNTPFGFFIQKCKRRHFNVLVFTGIHLQSCNGNPGQESTVPQLRQNWSKDWFQSFSAHAAFWFAFQKQRTFGEGTDVISGKLPVCVGRHPEYYIGSNALQISTFHLSQRKKQKQKVDRKTAVEGEMFLPLATLRNRKDLCSQWNVHKKHWFRGGQTCLQSGPRIQQCPEPKPDVLIFFSHWLQNKSQREKETVKNPPTPYCQQETQGQQRVASFASLSSFFPIFFLNK